MLFQGAGELGHSGLLLADGDIDANHVLSFLVQDGVQGDGGLSGLAVPDDELPLSPADGNHAVDGLDAGMKGFLDRLPLHHARGLELDSPAGGGVQGAFSIQGLAQGVDYASQKLLPCRHFGNSPGQRDGIPLVDLLGFPHEHHSHRIGLQVEDDSINIVGKFQQLSRHSVFQSVHDGHAVPDLDDLSDLGEFGLGFEFLDAGF